MGRFDIDDEDGYNLNNYFFGIRREPNPECVEEWIEEYEGCKIKHTINRGYWYRIYASLLPSPLFNMGCESIFPKK